MMNQYILQRKKELCKRKALVRNSIIAAFLLVLIAILSVFLFNFYMNKKMNRKFKNYYESVTMEKENFDEEITTLTSYLESEAISDKNKAIACDMISIMYSISNNIYESMSYMCKAFYYYSQINENASMVQMAVNLSATLVSATSYDIAEEILNRALNTPLKEEEETVLHVYVYTNLAESMSQRRNYDLAIEAIELAESKLELVNDELLEECVLSLEISKALARLGLGEVKQCKEILGSLDVKCIEKNLDNQITFGIPYSEVESYLNLHLDNLKESKKYFEQYIKYCEEYEYNSMKLFYIKKYSELAKKLGYDNLSFLSEYQDNLIELYQEELEHSNNETAKILLDAYTISSENIAIHTRQREIRVKALGISAILLVVILLSVIVFLRIKKKSQVDFLTGAYNRVKLRPVYRSLLRRKQEFYVMMFDIDNFKKCNDTYGHRFGDTVLEQIAQTVSLVLPKSAMLFRYGGEEFVVLCEMKTRKELKELAEMIRRSIEGLTWETGTTITISMGVCSSIDVTDPIKIADECLYYSKNNGKNRVTYHFERDK